MTSNNLVLAKVHIFFERPLYKSICSDKLHKGSKPFISSKTTDTYHAQLHFGDNGLCTKHPFHKNSFYIAFNQNGCEPIDSLALNEKDIAGLAVY
jgi:hypothetical protein